jgi:hypothetical protein
VSRECYTVSSYTPRHHIRFEFGGGRQGFHEFTLQEVDGTTCLLRHVTKAKLTFSSAWRWYFLIRPLHNALIEDLFDKVESQVAKVVHPQVWSSACSLGPASTGRVKGGLEMVKLKGRGWRSGVIGGLNRSGREGSLM